MYKLHLSLTTHVSWNSLVPLHAISIHLHVKLRWNLNNTEWKFNIYKVFCAIYKKFLTVIDHINYHPSQQYYGNTTRRKRSKWYSQYRWYHTQQRILTPSEENFLDAFMKVLYKINQPLHNNLLCMKRQGILTWILGWGVFLNVRSISKIKDNLHTLQKQNQL